MRTETREIFKFSELSDDAKEKAREWWRRASEGDDFFAESVIEDAKECARILGIEFGIMRGYSDRPSVYWSGFCHQGQGASFEGSYRYAKGSAKAIRAHAPQDAELHRIADELQILQRRIFYRGAFDIVQSGRYCHEYTMRLEGSETFPDDLAEDFLECFRDFARWIYKNLEAEYDYQNSDEYIKDSMEANEYEFDAKGERV